jgi:drug/metabolite transporter (DMT)-like permease
MALPLNALTALAAAASWGGGDFSGGMGVKAAGGSTTGALRVVILAHATSLVVLLVLLAIAGYTVPYGALLWWGVLAGVVAAFSLTAFYMALARGAMGASAAVSGLLAAAIPAVVSTALDGAPAGLRIAGFVLAAIAIWMIVAGHSPEDGAIRGSRREDRTTMALAVFGGLGFGVYFVALRLDNPLGVMEPMAIARTTSLTVCCLLFLAVKRFASKGSTRPQWGFSRGMLLGALGVAVLDTGGNLLFVAATRMGRLDVAAVLASLYPAGTILLAAWWLHELPTLRQQAGMVLALFAVVLITV